MSIKKPTKLPKIHLGTDHAGFELKESVKTWLAVEGYSVIDHGAKTLDPLDDFSDFVTLAVKALAKNPKNAKALIFGGSGHGEAMMANRFKKIRAAVYYGGDEEIITLSRHHNDANVLSIGARFVNTDLAKKVIWDWLHTEPLTDKKYQRRNKELDTLS